MSGRDACGAAASGLVSSETSPPTAEMLVADLNEERRRFGRMRRKLLTAARLMVDTWRGSRARWVMVTLTYADGVLFEPKHISRFVDRVRKYLAKHGQPCRYVWALEATQRGRPHYHCLFQLSYRVELPKPDQAGWWVHGHTKIEVAKRAVGYVAKYASKAGSGIWWKGARCFGMSGLSEGARAVLSFWSAPRWVRVAFGFCDDAGSLPETEVHLPVRRVRGGFVWEQTGEFAECPFVVKFAGGRVHFVRKAESCAA